MDTSRPSRPLGRFAGLLLLVLGLVGLALAPVAPAQAAPGDPGTVSGLVNGIDGQPLSGATVTLYDDAQAVAATQDTGADGLFDQLDAERLDHTQDPERLVDAPGAVRVQADSRLRAHALAHRTPL